MENIKNGNMDTGCECTNRGIVELLDGSVFNDCCCAACETETQQHECYKAQILKGMFLGSQLRRQKDRSIYSL